MKKTLLIEVDFVEETMRVFAAEKEGKQKEYQDYVEPTFTDDDFNENWTDKFSWSTNV